MNNIQFIMNFFITGGAGFIGSHLVTALINLGKKITIYDNFSNSSKDKISPLIQKRVNIIEGDILDFDKLSESMKGHDIVIHLATQIDVNESIKNPDFTKKVNVDGTINVLNLCKTNKIKNFIALSSAAVYGNSNDLPLKETSTLKPISPYGQSKLDMEKEIQNFSENNDLNSIILRPFNVFGKGQTDVYAGVITKFCNNIKNNRSLVIFGDGTFTRDFVHVSDVVQAIINASNKIEGKKGRVYNISSEKKTSIQELAELILSISGKTLEINHLPTKTGDIPHSLASSELAEKELEYVPKTFLKKGLKDLLYSDSF
ncbi:MAG: NAD-dependent epimerase/dehydratase family protein [Nitrosopumilus sp.]|nr:NAD-dependent epimerase/dehydratase family protein [Nitrosopumilus sp.]